MKCKRHPQVETALSCGKCGDPICPRCTVQTPVGIRCPTCARMSRVPTYNVSGGFYLRAIGAGLGAAVIAGIAWGLLQAIVPFFYLSFLIAGAVGYGIGELISLAVNRKAGTGLAVIGAVAVLFAYIINTFTFFGRGFHLFDIVAIIVGIAVVVARLR
jgi:hypothetical protein